MNLLYEDMHDTTYDDLQTHTKQIENPSISFDEYIANIKRGMGEGKGDNNPNPNPNPNTNPNLQRPVKGLKVVQPLGRLGRALGGLEVRHHRNRRRGASRLGHARERAFGRHGGPGGQRLVLTARALLALAGAAAGGYNPLVEQLLV